MDVFRKTRREATSHVLPTSMRKFEGVVEAAPMGRIVGPQLRHFYENATWTLSYIE